MKRDEAIISSGQPFAAEIGNGNIRWRITSRGSGADVLRRFDGFFYGYFYFFACPGAGGA